MASASLLSVDDTVSQQMSCLSGSYRISTSSPMMGPDRRGCCIVEGSVGTGCNSEGLASPLPTLRCRVEHKLLTIDMGNERKSKVRAVHLPQSKMKPVQWLVGLEKLYPHVLKAQMFDSEPWIWGRHEHRVEEPETKPSVRDGAHSWNCPHPLTGKNGWAIWGFSIYW